MKDIRVLDCTLRDGGCVNDFNFGTTYIQQIRQGLEQSKVDIIECGYIDEKNGTESGRTQFINDLAIKKVIADKRLGTLYVAMFDYGKFDPNKLLPKADDTIDGIRIAFHKKDWIEAIRAAKIVYAKGYRVFIQPMLILRYNDAEILELIQSVNMELPHAEAFYIVDSFGEMRQPDLDRLFHLVVHNLNPDICLGFHSHNNLQLSYANAIHLIEQNVKRRLLIDSSVSGMGKGAGNLSTELLLDYLNHYYGTHYEIQPLLDIIDKVLNQIYVNYKWGYSAEYFLSAVNSCTPSYAKHFFSKHLLSIDQIGQLLSQIPENKKISFDKKFADELYYEFNNTKCDDRESLEILRDRLAGKKVLLLAHGKSIVTHAQQIAQYLSDKAFCSIGLNMVDFFQMDFIYTNKQWVYADAKKQGVTPIVLSNIAQEDHTDIVLDYGKWSKDGDRVLESSFQVILHLLSALHVSEIYLAGFDGFDIDIDNNYYKDELRRTLSKDQVSQMNAQVINTIKQYCDKLTFTFITPTKYEG